MTRPSAPTVLGALALAVYTTALLVVALCPEL